VCECRCVRHRRFLIRHTTNCSGCSQRPVVIVTEGSKRSPLIAPPDCECERESQREGRKRWHRVAQQRWRDRLFAVISVFISTLSCCVPGIADILSASSRCLTRQLGLFACVLCYGREDADALWHVCQVCMRWESTCVDSHAHLDTHTHWLDVWCLWPAEGHIAALARGPPCHGKYLWLQT